MRRRDTPATVGITVPTSPICPAAKLKLLDGILRRDRAAVEPRKLSRPRAELDVPAGAVPIDENRRCGHGACLGPGLSVGLLPVVPRWGAEGPALPTGDRSTLGQLPRAWLRVENHSGQRRRPERLPPVFPLSSRACGILPLQPIRCGARADTYLYAVHNPPHLRLA